MIDLDPLDPRLEPERLREFYLAVREVGPKARRVSDSICRFRSTHAYDVADDTVREQVRTVGHATAKIPSGLAPTEHLLRGHLADWPPELDIDVGPRSEPWRRLAIGHALLVYLGELPGDDQEVDAGEPSGPPSRRPTRKTRRASVSAASDQLSFGFDEDAGASGAFDLEESREGYRAVSTVRFRVALFSETARRLLATDTCSLFPTFAQLYTNFCCYLDDEFDRRLRDLSVALVFR